MLARGWSGDRSSSPKGKVIEPVLLDCAGRRRSPATIASFHEGRPLRNKGVRYPADPPTVAEIIAVMRAAGGHDDGVRLRGVIVVLWRAGLRISEALALSETDLDRARGSILVRRGKGGRYLHTAAPECPAIKTRRPEARGGGASAPALQRRPWPTPLNGWVDIPQPVAVHRPTFHGTSAKGTSLTHVSRDAAGLRQAPVSLGESNAGPGRAEPQPR